MKKNERLSVIRDLVNQKQIGTQEELVDFLKEAGIVATQATISRDIKELGIIKIPVEQGYIYGLPKSKSGQLVSRTVRRVRSMGKMLHVDVIPGSTAVLKRQLSDQFEDQIFSIIADDDSLLVIANEQADIPQMEHLIKAW